MIKDVSNLRSEIEVNACFSNAGIGLIYAIDNIWVPESTLLFLEQDVVVVLPNLGLSRLIAETLAWPRRSVPGAGLESQRTCLAFYANSIHFPTFLKPYHGAGFKTSDIEENTATCSRLVYMSKKDGSIESYVRIFFE